MDREDRSVRRLQRRVARFVAEQRLLTSGDRVLVACSGGPDSVCLGHVLTALAGELGVDLRVAYFDHRLRGPEASLAERSAAQAAARLAGTDLVAGQWTEPQPSEQAARAARHRFLADTARELGCQRIALGHTADDRAETVLLNVIRGAGLKGLAALGPSDPNPAVLGAPPLVRPLLELRRSETRAYVRSAGLDAVDDPTNEDPTFTRNRVRLEVLPLLERLNPRVGTALVRLGSAAREADEALGEEAATLFQQALLGELPVRLSREALAQAGPALAKRALVLAAAVSHWPSPEAGHLDAAWRGVQRGGGSYDFPGGRVTVRRREVRFETAAADEGATSVPAAVLPLPGSTRFGRYVVTASEAGPSTADRPPTEALVDPGSAERFLVRAWQPGDRLQPLGMEGTRKLQDLFSDLKVEPLERELVPVVCDGDQIVWVAGLRMSHRYRVTEGTRRAVLLRLSEAGPEPRGREQRGRVGR